MKFKDMLYHTVAKNPKSQKSHGSVKNGKSVFSRLGDLYARMEAAYTNCAAHAGFNCAHCETNCCTSYFQHHTHIEWAYLWRGLTELPNPRLESIRDRAKGYLDHAHTALMRGVTPIAMCPLNEDGLCTLYKHRLMICRMHGTRNTLTLPNGRQQVFPGCIRFQNLPSNDDGQGTLDRTLYYQELAELELAFRQRANKPLTRVDLTLAEMIVLGPPKLQ